MTPATTSSAMLDEVTSFDCRKNCSMTVEPIEISTNAGSHLPPLAAPSTAADMRTAQAVALPTRVDWEATATATNAASCCPDREQAPAAQAARRRDGASWAGWALCAARSSSSVAKNMIPTTREGSDSIRGACTRCAPLPSELQATDSAVSKRPGLRVHAPKRAPRKTAWTSTQPRSEWLACGLSSLCTGGGAATSTLSSSHCTWPEMPERAPSVRVAFARMRACAAWRGANLTHAQSTAA